MLSSRRVSGARRIVVNRLIPQRTIFLASVIVLGTCGAGGQTLPLRDPAVVQKPLAPLGSSSSAERKGLLAIDVVVTDAAGNPASDLESRDFILLDNGQPSRIRTLHNSWAASEPAPELILILDTVNLSPQQLRQTESETAHFLRRNNGHLEAPSFLYRFTRDGLFSSSTLTRDGNVLAKEVEQHKSPRTVWSWNQNSEPWAGGPQRNPLSLRALGSIAIDQREIAGRKVAIWIGPGWPVQGSGESDFDDMTELSTRLREARITLDNVTVWPNPEVPVFDAHSYLEPPSSQKDMHPVKMALQAVATYAGGVVLDSSGELDQTIEHCVEEEWSSYTLTFNPPHTYRVDEFHALRVQVDRPALTVRAPTGYYNEPVYFDNPRPGTERVTVAQLEDLVHSQTDLVRKLENLELTERLSTPRLDALLAVIHGERERQALTADADLSIALAPPADEIVNRPPPPVDEQRAILRRTFDYLQNAIPKLPDFYALRDTVRFEEPRQRDNEIWKTPHKDQTLHFGSSEHATVFYRNGNEVVEKKQKLGKRSVNRGVRARYLETWGTFGPILAYVLTAAATSPSSLRWKRWESGKYGDLAVFSYRVASTSRVPGLTYCCLPEGDGTTPYQNRADTFGEFALNPDSGAIMRVVINADLDEERDPDVPLIRSQLMVEYGPVDLGGLTYTCPQRSVTISRGRSERELHEWGMDFNIYSYFETLINDGTFGGYHKFGSEARMLPGFDETEETKTPAPAKNPN